MEQVRLQFGRRMLLENLHLDIYQGEFITILGPNGAGKSTLLKLLLGLLKPTAGTVRVLGKAPRRGNQDVGYAPQHRALEADLALRAREANIGQRVPGKGQPANNQEIAHKRRDHRDKRAC